MGRLSTFWELLAELGTLIIVCLFVLGVLLILFGVPLFALAATVYVIVWAAIMALKATGVIHLVAMLI